MDNINKIKKDLSSWDILEIAKHVKNKDVVKNLVLNNRTDVLLEAIFKNKFFIFEQAIINGFDFEERIILHLHHALKADKIKYVNLLLTHAKNIVEYVNKQEDITLDNPLHVCMKYEIKNKSEVILLLSKSNTSWNTINTDGHTPLHMLIRDYTLLNEDIIEEIIKKADFNIQDINGVSTYDIIESMSFDKDWLKIPTIKLLLEKLKK